MASARITEEDIDNLDDLDKAVELMNQLDLNSDEVEELLDAQHELRKYLANSKEVQSSETEGIPNEVYEITAANSTKLIQHLMEANMATRKQLQQFVKRCEELVKKLPETRRADLCAVYPNAQADLVQVQEELYLNECVILVAGETGAGKSTLLNLLLGELAKELLPVAHMSSTSAICELKYCTHGKLVIHFTDPGIEPKTLDLGENAAETISQHVHQKGFRGEASFEYSKVEVHWPCEWLKGGITIVDSPGVGENPELTDLVKQYLPKAFGFIYVINTPNAGGIDPDRLQDLIFSHIAEQKKGIVGQFNPRSAVFVCNKWDDVPPAEKDKVRAYVMSQLHKTWPGFAEEQVFFMSAQQAIKQLRDNMVAYDYSALLHGIERLIPVGLNNKLAKQYSVAKNIIDRCRLILKAFIFEGEVKTESISEKVQAARERLDMLVKQPKKLQSQLEMKIHSLVGKATKELNDYLTNPDTRQRLCQWSRRDCQPLASSTSLETLQERMTGKITKRIKTEINDWDLKNQAFQKIHDTMLATFKQQFKFIASELKSIETSFTSDPEDIMQTIIDGMQTDSELPEPDLNFTLSEKLVIGFSAPIWVPISLVVGIFALPVAGVMALNKKRKRLKHLKEMKANLEQHMKELTESILDEMIDSPKLEEALKEKNDELMKAFSKLLDGIPRLIEADCKLLDQMEQEFKAQARQMDETYRPLYYDIDDLITEMNCLYLCAIRAYDIEINDLSNYEYLGEGQFAKVYLAQWKPNKSLPPSLVAVKALKDPVDPDNATDILQEEENLRNLQSPNVVEYHGTGVSHLDHKTFPLYVMEYCSSTLSDIVCDPSYPAPGNCKSYTSSDFAPAMKTAACYAHQVSSGLKAIHQAGYLHRDLKPENILVSSDGVVKLADLGLAKKAIDITGTLCGTPLYMAPEVLKEQQYNQKADMFGFGMMLWELWYGKCVIEVYQVDNFKQFLEHPFLSRSLEPNGVFRELMLKCWKDDPKARPSAHDCSRAIGSAYLEK